jgi:DNA-binding transcriptional MocR family regulator
LDADLTRRTILLGPRAHELRSYVGSTAWAVLEEMMQRSTGNGDHVVAQVPVRSLAASLGLAKDTVARAVRRLRDLGVIEAVQARSESGVFEAGSYRLAVPVACLSVVCPSQPAAAPSAVRPSSARRPSGQLSLLSEV